MSGKVEIGKGKKKKEVDAVKCVAAATGVKWSENRKPKADNEFRRSESDFPSRGVMELRPVTHLITTRT